MFDIKAWVRYTRVQGYEFFNAKSVRALKDVDLNIEERAAIEHQIAKYKRNGKVGIIWDSMDCDCCRTTYGRVANASLMSLMRTIHQSYDDAEGLISYSFCEPQTAKEYNRTSRDLALEAFEDGHHWVIYA
jgi:hypothetical protein